MDLLEYQGKQLLARHGLKVSSGAAVQSVADAVKAANEVGYPVVVKAQVLIGGRGKAGDTVEQGQLLCIIEAMKMENEITAHKAGTISELPITEGAAIQAGAPIATITSPST